MKHFNDIETIYKDGIIDHGSVYECSVCRTPYKREKAARAHFEKQSCHKIYHVFQGTETENLLYHIFKQLMAVFGGYAISKLKFRQGRFYTPIGRFYLYCYSNRVRDQIDYLQFILENYDCKNPNTATALGRKESVLKAYRKDRGNRQIDDDMMSFFREYEEQLGDNLFLIRSLERGDISVAVLEQHIDLDAFVSSLSDIEAGRLNTFFDMMEG